MMQDTSSTSATIEDAPESALIAGLRSGDDQCYARLMRQYGPSMLSRARYILQNEDDAHDAVQLAFVAVFRHIGRFEQRARLSTWLHSIVSNAALSMQRQRTRRARREQPLVEADQIASPPERGPERLLVDEQQRHMLAVAVARLGPRYREVLDHDLAGLSSHDAASQLSLSRSAHKSRRFRAFRALRDALLERGRPAASLRAAATHQNRTCRPPEAETRRGRTSLPARVVVSPARADVCVV